MDSKKRIKEILKEFLPEKENLLPVIKKINQQNSFFSQQAVEMIAEYFGISKSKVFQTASFYDEIKTKKPALVEVGICDSLNCENKSSEKIIQSLENFFKVKVEDDFNEKLKIKRISCQGRCLVGPIMVVNGNVYEKVTPSFAIETVGSYLGIKAFI